MRGEAVISLRFLDEPAYVLFGGILPVEDSGEVKIRRSPDEVVAYPAEGRPVLAYLSTLHSRSEAVAAIATWDGDPDDLDTLVGQGVLVRFPAPDEEAVRGILGPLTVRVPGEAKVAPDGEYMLLLLGNGRAVGVCLLTVAVLNSTAVRPLGDAVAAVAGTSGVAQEAVWRSVVHDLTGVLSTGAGHLARAGEE